MVTNNSWVNFFYLKNNIIKYAVWYIVYTSTVSIILNWTIPLTCTFHIISFDAIYNARPNKKILFNTTTHAHLIFHHIFAQNHYLLLLEAENLAAINIPVQVFLPFLPCFPQRLLLNLSYIDANMQIYIYNIFSYSLLYVMYVVHAIIIQNNVVYKPANINLC